ncbi:MAG: cobalamin-binding protein [Deltaproteobacteria bacterium]|nr:cobalamin-binding protein [Deltaproteobacteria bacterium]
MEQMRFRLFIFSLSIIIALSAVEAPASARSFEDALGRKITLRSAPKRIIPLAPNLTEILYALGLGDRVVGVTRFSSYPPEAASKPKVGSYIDINVERIISLSPDLVIATVDGNAQGTVELLEQAGIKIFIVNPRTITQVIDTIKTMGKVCGVQQEALYVAKRLQGRVERVVEKTRGRGTPGVFLEINIRPIMSVNKKTFHHDLIRLAGGRNITEDEPITYPRINIEEVIRRRPDVIIISSMERGSRFEMARKEWLKWPSIPAVKNGRVYLIDSDLIDRPSPRLVQGLEEMAKLIHPEIQW